MADRELTLRYGMNPHQKPARAYVEGGTLPFEVRNGSPQRSSRLDEAIRRQPPCCSQLELRRGVVQRVEEIVCRADEDALGTLPDSGSRAEIEAFLKRARTLAPPTEPGTRGRAGGLRWSFPFPDFP